VAQLRQRRRARGTAWDEEPGRVDQQGSVGVLAGQLLADPLHLHPVGQVGGDAGGFAVLGQRLDRVVDPAGVQADDHGPAAGGDDVGGGLPPIPLLPPTTTSF
jgi:hypothetical protein